MKILVSFQPNKKAPDFEGVRLRKTIKGALEMAEVDYTTSVVEKYDAVHLITPDDENKLNDAKENHVPVIVSALYCESDPVVYNMFLITLCRREKRRAILINRYDLVCILIDHVLYST